jgi:ABC-type polysaccharide/polyol phosphate export permease
MVADLAQVLKLWPIWSRLGLQEFRLRFHRSALGTTWIFLQLSVMILAIGVIYSQLFGQDMHSFLPYLTVGLIAWAYLTGAICEGGSVFPSSEGYIKQIGLPVDVYVLRFFVRLTLTLLVSLPAYVVVALVYGIELGWGVLWFLPGVILVAAVAFLLSWIFAYLNARFRDVAHLATTLTQVVFYVTPVIWPQEMLRSRGQLAWIIDWNPFYHVLEVFRHPLLACEPADAVNYASVLVILLVLAVTAWIVRRCYGRQLVYVL